MSPHELSPDPLGAKGESRFQEICEDARLICNKSTRDRTGWDFIVEFQFEDVGDATSLDSRAAPLSCHVQVKTLREGSDRFRMRLSSAERLAKEMKPAFVYVFKVVGTEFTQAFLIHIIDEPLAMILQRLREVEHTGPEGRPINRKYISFAPSRYGMPIEPTGAALRGAMEAACGRNLRDYSIHKTQQIRGLGFQPFSYKGTFRFLTLRGLDEVVDVFLGIQRNVEIDHLKAFEVRFGIPLPLRQFTPGTHLISIDPQPVDTCTIIVRNDELGSPSVFDANLCIPPIPGLPIHAFKVLIRTPLFSVLIPFQGQLSFWHAEDIRTHKHPVERWVDLARIMLSLATGKASIEIRSNNRPDHIEFTVEEVATSLDAAAWTRWLAICEFTLSLFRAAGVSREEEISIQNIDESANQILEAYALLNGQVNEICFRATRPETPVTNAPMDTLVINYVRVGDVILAYYTIVDLAPEINSDYVLWKSIRITPGQIRPLRRAPGEFANFVENARAETKTDMFLVQRSPEDLSG
jgi:hypothetical protein